ncbi:MAG: DUF3990 domain-containing protein [Acetatifactor sp.]|nr:DUF3990 domain-containing protein [Acetatifactor sp.]
MLYESCDMMIGYRADDSYFSFAQDFINGTISYRQLNNALHLGRIGQQFSKAEQRLTAFSLWAAKQLNAANGMQKNVAR